MRDKIYYYDHNGVLKLTLNEWPYYSEPAEWKDWVWAYNEQFGRINTFRRNKREWTMPIVIASDDPAQHDALCDIFSFDVLANQPGRIVLRDWSLSCYIIQAGYEYGGANYDFDRKATFLVRAVDSTWIRETTRTFSGVPGGSGTDEDLWRDYVASDEWIRTTLFTDGTLIINETRSQRDGNIALHGEVLNEYDPAPYVLTANNQQPWQAQKSQITAVEIGSALSPPSTAYWFQGLTRCTSFDLHRLDLSRTTTIARMFYQCTAVTTIDVSQWDLRSCTAAGYVFYGCTNLTTLDVSNWNTESFVNIANIFYNCRNLAALDVSNWNTSNVTTLQYVFNGCQSLTTLDVSNWDTRKVTSLFGTFYNCIGLTSLNLSNWDTRRVTTMRQAFAFTRFTSLDLRSFVTPALTLTNLMFNGCEQLVTIYATNAFDVSNVTDSTDMFLNCISIVGGAGTTYQNGYKDKTRAKIDGGPSSPGYFSS